MAAMSAYTIKSLRELEDASGGRAPGIQARFARSHIDSEHIGVSKIDYEPGVRSPVGHHHGEQEEVYVVLSGSGKVKLDDDIHDVRAWDVIRVAPATVRAFESGSDGLELLAIGSDRPEDGDGVLVPDFWPA